VAAKLALRAESEAYQQGDKNPEIDIVCAV
jgi:hypothetical protein